jgi:hypothetical protein
MRKGKCSKNFLGVSYAYQVFAKQKKTLGKLLLIGHKLCRISSNFMPARVLLWLQL